MNARDVVLRLIEPDGNLPVVLAQGLFAEQYRAVPLRVGEGITGSVALSGQAEYINDPLSDPRIAHVPGYRRRAGSDHVRTAQSRREGDRCAGCLAAIR